MKNRLLLFLSVLFTSLNAQEVITIAGAGQIGSANGPAETATFNNPHGIATDNQGTIYVADRYGHQIRKISPSGDVTVLAGSGLLGDSDGTGTAASFREPWGLCVGNDGNIYVADTKNNLIRKVTPQGVVTTLAGNGSYGITDGPANLASFGNPTGIEMDDAGNLYIADHATHIIRKITPDGTVSRLAGAPYCFGLEDGPAGQSLFNRPYGLTIDNDGNIIVADEWNHAIRSVTPSGDVTTLAGNGTIGHDDGFGNYTTFNYPWDVTVDNKGNIFVADGYNHSMRKLIPSGSSPLTYGVLTFAGVSGETGWVDGYGTEVEFNGAASLHYCKQSGEVFIADTYNNKIRKAIDHEEQSVLLEIQNNAQGVICVNDDLKVRAFPSNFDTYIFFIDGQIVQSGSNEEFVTNNLNSGEHTVMVHGINPSGSYISEVSSFTVLDAPVPVIEVVGNNPMPGGSMVLLKTDEAESCVWSNNETSESIVVEEPGIFTVDVLFSSGCVATSEPVNIQQVCTASSPIIEFADNSNDCDCFVGPTNLVTDFEDGELQWLYYGIPIPNAVGSTYEVRESGVYQVVATTTGGEQLYSNILHAHISEPFLEDFKANKTTIFASNPKVNFRSILTYNWGSYSYEWNFGDDASGDDNFSTKKNPKHVYSGVGVYNVTLKVTDNYTGCVQTIYKPDYIIYGEEMSEPDDDIRSRENIIYVPNAFSPNGDGENDILYVRGEEINEIEFFVYDQNGKLVFESNDLSIGWDGNLNGRQASNETYSYIAKVKMQNGSSETRSGKVFLIR